MQDNSLKPCPFCGAPANIWRTNYATYIECRESDQWHRVQISSRTEGQARIWWNSRAAGAAAPGNFSGGEAASQAAGEEKG